MDTHVRAHRLGRVCVAPVDVVLDPDGPLVVQPDIIFVSNERAAIVRDRVWGAPDLVVEVLSPRTAARDRTTKLDWYERYGVRECWLSDAQRRSIEVVRLGENGGRLTFTAGSVPQSIVLPAWSASIDDIFD
jgi:Uma2 family endonuclease